MLAYMNDASSPQKRIQHFGRRSRLSPKVRRNNFLLLSSPLTTAIVKGFGCRPQWMAWGVRLAAGVRKPPREETAGEGLERYGLGYGDLSAAVEAADRGRGGRREG